MCLKFRNKILKSSDDKCCLYSNVTAFQTFPPDYPFLLYNEDDIFFGGAFKM